MNTALNNQAFFLQPGDFYQIDLGLPTGTPYNSWFVEVDSDGAPAPIADWFEFDGGILSIDAPEDLFTNSTYYAGDNPSRFGHDYHHFNLTLTFEVDGGNIYTDDYTVSIVPIASSIGEAGDLDTFFLDYASSWHTAFSEDGALIINAS